MERLTVKHRPTLSRSANGQGPKIEGYGAVFYKEGDPGTEYELMRYAGNRLVERLMLGCFARAIREDDCRGMFNHDPSLLLGRVSANTLRLTEDARGLRYQITPPDTSYAADLLACLKRGDVSGSSFSFSYLDTSERDIRQPDGTTLTVIEVRDLKLFDTGPVSLPAYTSTTAEARKKGILASKPRRFELPARAALPKDRRRCRAIMRLRVLDLDEDEALFRRA